MRTKTKNIIETTIATIAISVLYSLNNYKSLIENIKPLFFVIGGTIIAMTIIHIFIYFVNEGDKVINGHFENLKNKPAASNFKSAETTNEDEYDCMDREMTNDEKQQFIQILKNY